MQYYSTLCRFTFERIHKNMRRPPDFRITGPDTSNNSAHEEILYSKLS